MGNKILLIGGGGNCRSIVDVLLENELYDAIGIVDKQIIDMSSFSKRIIYVGSDDDLNRLFSSGWDKAFVSLGSVGDSSKRRHIFSLIKKIGFSVPNIISETAIVSKNASFGEGVFVSKGAVINTNSSIGDCSIINSNSVIEHDCIIGDFSHVSPGAVLCGGVHLGSDSHIGAGAIVKQYITIGKSTIVGMGSVVTKNLDSNSLYYGNPCRLIKKVVK